MTSRFTTVVGLGVGQVFGRISCVVRGWSGGWPYGTCGHVLVIGTIAKAKKTYFGRMLVIWHVWLCIGHMIGDN